MLLKSSLQDFETKHALAFPQNSLKVAMDIHKKTIILLYTRSCRVRGISDQVSTTKKGEALQLLQHHLLILNCTKQPSLNLQYQVKDLSIDNVLVFIIKNHEQYLSSQDLEKLRAVNELHNNIISDVLELRLVDFLSLKNLRFEYADQLSICQTRVLLATAGLIH
jgi:hypothetical protein